MSTLKTIIRKLILRIQAALILLEEDKIEGAKKELAKAIKLLS